MQPLLNRWLFKFGPKVAMSICDDAFFFQSPDIAEPLRIPAYAGVAADNGKVLVVGNEPFDWEVCPPSLTRNRVVDSGFVVDSAGAGAIMMSGFRKLFPRRILRVRPTVVLACRTGGDKIELAKRAVLEAGAAEVYFIEHPMAALIGLDVDVRGADLSAVLTVSNDWFSFAIVSLSGIVASCDGSMGVEDLVRDIRIHCRLTRGFVPDEKAVAAALWRNGFADSGGYPAAGWTTWLGKSGLGERDTRVLDTGLLRDGAMPTVLRISERIQTLIENLPSEMRARMNSVTVHGTGCAMGIARFAKLMETQIGMRIEPRLDKPQPAVAGALKAIAEIPFLRRVTKNARA